MEETQVITLCPVMTHIRIAQPQAAIFFEGNPTGFIIHGLVLEAAIRVGAHRYLLFVTDDVIFEEMLTLLLLDLSQGVVEKLTIGGAYTSGHFEDLKVSPHSASFSFIGDTTWTVKVSESPTLKLPFSDPRGVSRPMGFKKYIDISADPAPARADGSR